jgi:ankyrin repeat/IBR domain-containing protein 1
MGSQWSKLKKAVERGDEVKAIEIYNRSDDIRRRLHGDSIVNEQTLDTYMHLSGRYGMIDFLKLMLYENRGNPNKLNRHNQTVLHKVCQGYHDIRQYECMKLLLQWHDSAMSASVLMVKAATAGTTAAAAPAAVSETPNTNNINNPQQLSFVDVNVNAKDEYDNTPLHYAAMRNLPTCVQTLVAHGAYLFVENLEHSTPCDLAERAGHKDIALYLESKMIFSVRVFQKDLGEKRTKKCKRRIKTKKLFFL